MYIFYLLYINFLVRFNFELKQTISYNWIKLHFIVNSMLVILIDFLLQPSKKIVFTFWINDSNDNSGECKLLIRPKTSTGLHLCPDGGPSNETLGITLKNCTSRFFLAIFYVNGTRVEADKHGQPLKLIALTLPYLNW